jgi:hypothetical protein
MLPFVLFFIKRMTAVDSTAIFVTLISLLNYIAQVIKRITAVDNTAIFVTLISLLNYISQVIKRITAVDNTAIFVTLISLLNYITQDISTFLPYHATKKPIFVTKFDSLITAVIVNKCSVVFEVIRRRPLTAEARVNIGPVHVGVLVDK